MIPDNRASRFGPNFLEEGFAVVTFNPKLKLEEWEYLMECQKLAMEYKQEEIEKKEKTLITHAEEKKKARDKADAEKKLRDAKHLEELKKENDIKPNEN